MKRVPFSVKPSSASTWEEVFKRPGPVSAESFVTAAAILKKQGALNLEHPKAADMKNEPVKAVVQSHLVRHTEFGAYLVDAGLDAAYQKRPHGGYRGILVGMFLGKSYQEKEQHILSRLEEKGITLKGIFFTHLHFDHIAGVIDIPGDLPVQYVAGKDDPHFVVNKKFLFRSPDFLQGVETLYEIDFNDAHAIDMPVLGKCADIFGDGSLWAVSTPGHSVGHLSFLVNGEQGPVFLTGDACLLKEGFELGIGPGKYSSNIEEAQKSLDKIIEFSQKYPEVRVVLGHHAPAKRG